MLFWHGGVALSATANDPDLTCLGGDPHFALVSCDLFCFGEHFDLSFNSGGDLDLLLLVGDPDFSFTVCGESPDLTCCTGDNFFKSGEYLDLPLGDDLGCSWVNGEESDLPCLGGDLDFFNSKEISVMHFPRGERDFFFTSEEDPDEMCLEGEADLSLKV